MFESLSNRIQGVLKGLRSEARITEAHVDRSLREIRIALLEADVNFQVARAFIGRIRGQALGEAVLSSLTPGQQVVKIVRDELIELLGGSASPLEFGQVKPSTIMLVGLQGSGKTTSAGKLALWLRNQGHRPLLVSTDVYRPAALEQLRVIGEAVQIPVFSDTSRDALDLARKAHAECLKSGRDVLLVDTAGRLHVDESLMSELEELQGILAPAETLLVADAMTGQDAVTSATLFDERVGLTGVVLTKLDGDARGGAALSIRTVTGRPIKFVGVGEKYDALETFHPDRMANRILGMGDVLSLIEKAEQVVDEKQAEDMIRRIRRNEFTLEDFLAQLRQTASAGSPGSDPGHAPQGRSPERSRQTAGRRKAAWPSGGNYLLDDSRGAAEPQDHQRLPEKAHRCGLRTSCLRSESPLEAVRTDPKANEESQ